MTTRFDDEMSTGPSEARETRTRTSGGQDPSAILVRLIKHGRSGTESEAKRRETGFEQKETGRFGVPTMTANARTAAAGEDARMMEDGEMLRVVTVRSSARALTVVKEVATVRVNLECECSHSREN
jgi:hypothetical protein